MDKNTKWIQEFSNGYEDFGNAVEVDSENNIIAVENSYDGKKYACRIIKYDENGSIIWNKNYESKKQEMVYDVAIDSEDNIIIVGFDGEWTRDPLPNANANVVKYDKNGTLLWKQSFKKGICTIGFGIKTDSEDNIYLISTFFDLSEPNLGCCIIKCDRDGKHIWDKTYHEEYMDIPYGIAVDSNDNIIIVGYAFTPYRKNGKWTAGFLALKYDKQGVLLWSRRYLPLETAEALDVSVDSQDNIIIVGRNALVGKKKNDIILIKTNKNGDILWEKRLSTKNKNAPYGVVVSNNDKIIIGGTSYSSKIPKSFICEFDKNGELKWLKKLDIERTVFDISIDNKNSIITVGSIIGTVDKFYISKEETRD